MKKTVNLICLVLVFCCILPVNARDLVVILTVAETKIKIPDFKNLVAYDPQFNILARGVENKQDTTYSIKDLPGRDVVIACEFEHSLYSQDLKSLNGDTVLFMLPQSALQHTVNLKEVEVKADNSYITDKKTVFLPSKRDRRISSSGSSLLRNMAIPSLYVSPVDNAVSTAAGEGVSMYIDYAKASETSVANLNTDDVLRVEIYDYPDDPRFNGDRHVVNFVLVKYEYGGYTRLDVNQRFILNRGKYGVYSKMSYKDMVYEAGVNDEYTNNKYSYSNRYSTYKFHDEAVDCSSITDRSKIKSNNIGGFFKALYGTKKTMIDNTLGITSNHVPSSINDMIETFSTGNYQSGKSMSEKRSNTTGVSWKGNYFFIIPSNWTIMIMPSASYQKNSSYYEYKSSNDGVINDNVENAWNAILSMNFTKRFGSNSLTINLYGNALGDDMKYGGDMPATVKYKEYLSGLRVEPSFVFGKFFVRPSFSLYYSNATIGGYRVEHWMPKYFIPMSYAFNKKMRLNFSSEFYYASVPASSMAPNLQMQNQIMGIKGNPDLKTSRNIFNNLSFNWQISRSFSIAPNIQYSHTDRDLNYEYKPMEINGKEVMIRGIINNGVLNDWIFGLPVSFSTPNRKLTMRVGPNLYVLNQNGIMGIEKNYVGMNTQITYSFSDFFITGNYQTRSYNISRYQHTYNRAYYSFSGGWSNGKLKVTAYVICPFTTTYRQGYSDIVTSDYISHSDNYMPTYRCMFRVAASYTFSYGKKVSRGNEAQAPAAMQSGLLR